MLYYDYTWDLSDDKIILDEELDVHEIGWREGDLFKLVDIDGKRQLVKLDPIEKFIRGYE
jgi:hypothetical protein